MLKNNKALVWFIVLFGFQFVCTHIVQALAYQSIHQDVELMRKQLMENGVAVSSLSPMMWSIRDVGKEVFSSATSQIQMFAFSNSLMFFVVYSLATREKPDTEKTEPEP